MIVIVVIADSFRLDRDRIIPAAQIARDYRAWQDLAARTPPADRDDEATARNRGRALPEHGLTIAETPP